MKAMVISAFVIPLWKSVETFLAISAIVIAIQMITKYCKKLKYQRKIVLVTNGRGELDADGIEQITEKIKQDGIGLVVVYALLMALVQWDIDGATVELTSTIQNMVLKRKPRVLGRSDGLCNYVGVTLLTDF